MEPTTGIEPVNLFLTKEALYRLSYVGGKLVTDSLKTLKNNLIFIWSGRRDSNSRHPAWKAEALPAELLPLKYFFIYEIRAKNRETKLFPQKLKSISCRKSCSSNRSLTLNGNLLQATQLRLVVGGGFEPPKASPTDLQSVPFDHSGTPPEKPLKNRPGIQVAGRFVCRITFMEPAEGLEPTAY
jgi:hypothetical protein